MIPVTKAAVEAWDKRTLETEPAHNEENAGLADPETQEVSLPTDEKSELLKWPKKRPRVAHKPRHSQLENRYHP